jgi:hypothetical protein
MRQLRLGHHFVPLNPTFPIQAHQTRGPFQSRGCVPDEDDGASLAFPQELLEYLLLVREIERRGAWEQEERKQNKGYFIM